MHFLAFKSIFILFPKAEKIIKNTVKSAPLDEAIKNCFMQFSLCSSASLTIPGIISFHFLFFSFVYSFVHQFQYSSYRSSYSGIVHTLPIKAHSIQPLKSGPYTLNPDRGEDETPAPTPPPNQFNPGRSSIFARRLQIRRKIQIPRCRCRKNDLIYLVRR